MSEHEERHFDLGDLMDGSEKGPVGGTWPAEVDTGADVGGDGEEIDLSGGSSDAYESGQDQGSIA